MMLRKISIFLVVMIQALSLSAFEVAVEEVEKVKGNQGIVFQNFAGENFAFTNTAVQIRNIGRALATLNKEDNRLYTISNKYSVVEVTNEDADGLYSAAVISIDPSARVDHIRNVRQIIAGYLEGKYGYNAADADTLAFFLSFYNAVYRQNIDYLKTVYKPQMFDFLDASNAGLSLEYTEWPGKSRIIVPLTDRSSVSLAQLNQDVIASARDSKEDMAVEEREGLQTLKEKELAQAEDAKELSKDDQEKLQIILDEKETESTKAEQEAQAKQAEADRAKQAAEQAKATNAPDAAEKAKAAEQAQAEAAQAKQAAEQKKTEADQAKTAVEKEQAVQDQRKQEIEQIAQDKTAEEEKLAQDKAVIQEQQPAQQEQPAPAQQPAQQEQPAPAQPPAQQEQPAPAQPPAQTEREKVAEQAKANPQKVADELVKAREELENRPTLPIVADKFYYMSVSNRQSTGHYNNRIFAIDAASGTVLNSSANNVCSVNYLAYAGGVLVVTSRDTGHAGPHSLTILSLDTLAPVLETAKNVDIHWNSPVVLSGGKIYAMIVSQQKLYIARFNEKLEIEVQSKTAVDMDTSMTVYKDHVYANMTGSNRIVVFNKEDLSTLSEIAIPN